MSDNDLTIIIAFTALLLVIAVSLIDQKRRIEVKTWLHKVKARLRGLLHWWLNAPVDDDPDRWYW
jgi:hypothetical protein